MHTNNWFKLYRKIFESDIWLQPVEMRLFIFLIGQARYKEKPNTKYKSKGVIIERGQFLRSYRKLQEDLQYFENNAVKEYPLSKIKRAVDKLKDQERVKTEKTPLGTLFTVCNYCQYQGSDKKEGDTWNGDETELKQGWNGDETASEQYSKKVVRKKKKDKKEKNVNNIVPKTEIKKIYNSLTNYWTTLFEDYIDIYRQKNKTKKITDNRHMKLLKELCQIFQSQKFEFDGQEYNLTEKIFEKGVNEIIEKQINNLNYAKKVWISSIEKEANNDKQVSKDNREEKGAKREEESIFKYG